jgi:hypothetical protein
VRRNVEVGQWELRPFTVSVGTSTIANGTQHCATLIAQAMPRCTELELMAEIRSVAMAMFVIHQKR